MRFVKEYSNIFIIFQDSAEYLFSRFFKKGFRHCFAIQRCPIGWTCIDGNRSDLDITILPAPSGVDVITQLKKDNPDFTIIELNVYKTDKSIFPVFGLVSCVGTIKQLLGVKWRTVLTPYQLYRKLSTIDRKLDGRNIQWEMAARRKRHDKQLSKQKKVKDY